MSLAHFSVWYNVADKNSVWYNVADKNYEPTSSRAQPRYELKNDLGKIYLRHKQACLRIPTITQESHGDSYYYHLWHSRRKSTFQRQKRKMSFLYQKIALTSFYPMVLVALQYPFVSLSYKRSRPRSYTAEGEIKQTSLEQCFHSRP